MARTEPQRNYHDYSQEEYQILGILLHHPELIDEVADQLLPEHFSDPVSRTMYAALMTQYQNQGDISRTRLYLQLEQEALVENLDEVLDKLTQGFVIPKELEPAVQVVKTNFYRNQLAKAGIQIQELAEQVHRDVEECQAQAQELIMNATTETSAQRHVYSMEEALLESYNAYLDRKAKKVDTGVATGYISLDKIINGFRKGHLIVLAASTSVGKSAFALNMARNILKQNVPIAVISLEMDAQEIVDRIIIAESNVQGWRYDRGETTRDEDLHISQAIENLYKLPLSISDERGLTVAQVRARLRKFNAQMGGLGLAIIDYLQMLQIPQEGLNQGNIARAVGDNVLQLRNLASELDIPIILVSQISRSFKSRTDKRPVLSDLRDSGNIEEIADSVIFLYRHAHTSIGAREEAIQEGRERETEIIVAKNRTGMTGHAVLFFEEEYIRFVDPETLSIERSMPGEGQQP